MSLKENFRMEYMNIKVVYSLNQGLFWEVRIDTIGAEILQYLVDFIKLIYKGKSMLDVVFVILWILCSMSAWGYIS